MSLQPGRASALAEKEESACPEQIIPLCLCCIPGKREINWGREGRRGDLTHSPNTEEAVSLVVYEQNSPCLLWGSQPCKRVLQELRVQNIVQTARGFKHGSG